MGLEESEEKPVRRVFSPQEEAERSIIREYRSQLWAPFTRALNEYRLIEDGDRIAVCISGGKDSMLMAKLFQELYLHGRQNFELEFLVLNPGYDETSYGLVVHNAELLGIPIHTEPARIFDVVQRMGGNPCYPCAKMRRGALYSTAREIGCNKIALGHHFDDVIETILMGMFYAGQIKTMMPKIRSANYEGMELIRPLYFIRERDIVSWRDHNGLEFIHCSCPLADGREKTGAEGSKRDAIKALIAQLAADDPYLEKNIFRSADNVNLDAVTGYRLGGAHHSFLEHYNEGWEGWDE